MLKEKLRINVVKLDVDNDNSVEDTFKQILSEKGQIDVLVNNAGIGARGYIEEAPIAVFRQVMETNFFGSLRCIKSVVPSMRERKSGCIINITSVAGQFGMPPQGPYAASKWAFEGLSECLAQELSPFNVRVAIVEPGVIATPLTTTPRPAPPPSPYSMHGRRIGAYFAASLSKPTSPFEVAKTIQDIIDGSSTKLRNPSGADGAALINWRKSKTDEEWVSLGAASDAEWVDDMKKYTGVDMRLP
jgi:NAD(P)-dependent dehydrogenase (short-subunit alcohol dehydrogenase family)